MEGRGQTENLRYIALTFEGVALLTGSKVDAPTKQEIGNIEIILKNKVSHDSPIISNFIMLLQNLSQIYNEGVLDQKIFLSFTSKTIL